MNPLNSIRSVIPCLPGIYSHLCSSYIAWGKDLPQSPPGGFQSEEQIAQYPGAHLIDPSVTPGATEGMYAFVRLTVQRNIYRVPVQ